MEFYNIAKNEIFYDNILKKETTFTAPNEKGEMVEFEGEDTLFLERLSNEELKELGIAKVERMQMPNGISFMQEAMEIREYKEAENIYKISYKIVEKPLKTIKEAKRVEIDDKKQEIIVEGFSYQDKVYQCETYDQTLILGKVTQATLKPNESINWIAKDNTITTFSAQDFITFATALAGFIEQTTFRARTLKDKISMAQNKEEVEAVVWEETQETQETQETTPIAVGGES